MKRLATWLVGIFGAALLGFVLGFVLFAVNVMRAPEEDTAKADGIVVLTGGQLRIKEGMRLLEEGRGRRLLITGVYPRTGKADIARTSGISEADLKCCVDLGLSLIHI